MARAKRCVGVVAAGDGAIGEDRVLLRMTLGEVARRGADGVWRLAGRAVAADIIERLERRELVRIDGDIARVSELGRSRIERAEAPDRPNRWLARAGRVGRTPVLRDRLESPLAWLARRRLVTSRQLDAGERLRGDWQLARRPPSVTMRWDATPGVRRGGLVEPGDPTAVMLDARRRVEAALAAVGPGLAPIIERVVCEGQGLETTEREMGWPARAGKVVLGIALDRLVAHYRL